LRQLFKDIDVSTITSKENDTNNVSLGTACRKHQFFNSVGINTNEGSVEMWREQLYQILFLQLRPCK
jgi:hypothetical protein